MTTFEKLHYMKNNGISMKQIAKLANCAPQTISNWMTGKTEISIHLQRSLECAIVEFKKRLEEV